MEKLLKLLKEQNDLMNPNDELSRLIQSCRQEYEMSDDELDLDELDMVSAAQKIPEFKPVKLNLKDE